MQVSVEKMSNIRRRISLSLPVQKVDEAFKLSVNQYAKTAKLAGFRPGKVPVSYIIQHFGAELKRDSLSKMLETEIQTVLKNENLMPVSQVNIENLPSTNNDNLQFAVSFEVLPEINDIKFNLNEIEKLKVDILPLDIDRVINQLQKQYAEWKAVETEAQEKNRLIIDYSYQIDGENQEKPHEVKNYTLELGSHTMIPGFEEGLIGAKAGEERVLNLTFPTTYYQTERAGKEVTFKVKITKVYEGHEPTIDETFIKRLGIVSGQMDDLKEQINQTLSNERDRVVVEKIKSQVFDQLIQQNDIEVPDALVEREAARIHDEIHPEHNHKHEHSEDELNSFKEIAIKRVKLSLMINKLIEKEDLKPNPEKIKEKIQILAASYEHPQDVMEWLKSSPERLKGIEGQVLEDQVVDNLIKNVPVKEKEMSFAELKGIPI